MIGLEIGKTYNLPITIVDNDVFDIRHPVSNFDIEIRRKAINDFMDNNLSYPVYYKSIQHPLYINESLQVIKIN